MKVDVYCPCYNESRIAPFMLDYWARFATNVYVYDCGSTDGVQDILRGETRFNVELRDYPWKDEVNDEILTEFKNNIWKSSRGHADFVVICDFDEALWSDDLEWELVNMRANRQTICLPIIYQLLSKKFPVYIPHRLMHETIDFGYHYPWFGKRVLFNPNEIAEINFSAGCHACAPTGRVNYYDGGGIYLFHCKYIDLNYHLERHFLTQSRMSDINKTNGWGVQYMADKDAAIEEYNGMINKSKKLKL